MKLYELPVGLYCSVVYCELQWFNINPEKLGEPDILMRESKDGYKFHEYLYDGIMESGCGEILNRLAEIDNHIAVFPIQDDDLLGFFITNHTNVISNYVLNNGELNSGKLHDDIMFSISDRVCVTYKFDRLSQVEDLPSYKGVSSYLFKLDKGYTLYMCGSKDTIELYKDILVNAQYGVPNSITLTYLGEHGVEMFKSGNALADFREKMNLC